jgi:glycosyltransferase involved in cell wall biosynthesis
MARSSDLRVVHVGSGHYRPGDQDHVTYAIWRELASGFGHYHVIARSSAHPADWTEGNLRITLVRGWMRREAEFVVSQFATVPLIVRDRPHVILCQSPVAGGLAALVAAGRTGARLLMELHSDIYLPPFRFGSRSWAYHHLSRLPLRRADRIRVLSVGMLTRLAQSFGDEIARKARVLPPRVDLAGFGPGPSERTRSGPLRLIMVGSIIPRKGQLRLVDALQAARFPIELHLIGDGPDLAQCRARAGRNPARLTIVCHGAVPQSALPALLRDADVFVLYSNSEGTPRAILEAMAAGLPVVTTDAGFCADIVGHGIEGFVLGPDPDSEIIPLLERFHNDPALARKMGSAARTRAERDFDSVRLFEDYRRLIAETAES